MSNKRNKNKTKGLISLALYALLLKKDYEEISVKEICTRAGVSRMSFYRYYNRKDDIFIDYCDERFEEFYEGIKDQKDLTLRIFTLETFKFIKKYARQLKVLQTAHREFMLLDQLNSYARYVIANLLSDYLPNQKHNPVFAYFMAGGLFNVLKYWITNGMQASPEEMNNMLYSILDTKEL